MSEQNIGIQFCAMVLSTIFLYKTYVYEFENCEEICSNFNCQFVPDEQTESDGE